MSGRFEGHVFRHFGGELGHLHAEILEMTALVLVQIQKVLEAVKPQNRKDAHVIIKNEPSVNFLANKIDNSIFEILTKRETVARDLRAIMGFSKMVTDLKYLGDEGDRISCLSTKIYCIEFSHQDTDMLREIDIVGKYSCTVLEETIAILKTFDVKSARKMLAHTDLDEEFNASLRRLTTYVLEDASKMKHTVNIILILKSLERIYAHARNLVEHVAYIAHENPTA